MVDKNGVKIKPGYVLYNPHDEYGYYTVIAGPDDKLFLGDLDSPLERFSPEEFWTISNRNKESATTCL